jgi:hypothetical protein
VQPLAPQIEEPVAERGSSGNSGLAVDLERKRLGVDSTVSAATASSTSPVGSFGFSAPGALRTTSPLTVITLSRCRRSAWAKGGLPPATTTCVIP